MYWNTVNSTTSHLRIYYVLHRQRNRKSNVVRPAWHHNAHNHFTSLYSLRRSMPFVCVVQSDALMHVISDGKLTCKIGRAQLVVANFVLCC